MKRAEKKSHLVQVARDLFNRLGYRATGVDQVIAEAGIAKTTLYRHFETKEDLIVAVLHEIDDQYREAMRQFVDRKTSDPKQKIGATFGYLESWFKEDTFFGCPFICAAKEYCERSSPVFQEAVLHKRLMIAYFEELARAAKLKNPKRIAEEINLLHEGAISVAHVTGDTRAAQKAKAMAEILIE